MQIWWNEQSAFPKINKALDRNSGLFAPSDIMIKLHMVRQPCLYVGTPAVCTPPTCQITHSIIELQNDVIRRFTGTKLQTNYSVITKLFDSL